MSKAAKWAFLCITTASLFGFLLFAFLVRHRPVFFDRDDPLGYYVYLRSACHDHDLDFRNEYEYFRSLGSPLGYNLGRIDPVTGRADNNYTVGFPLLASPLYFPPSMLLSRGSVSLDRFPWFRDQVIFSIAGLVLGILGLWFTFKFTALYFSQQESAWATLLFWACSPWIYYFTREPFQSHMASLFAASGFLFAWKAPNLSSAARSFLMGLLGGLVVVTRQQDVFLLAIPLISEWRTLLNSRNWRYAVIFVASFLLIASFQMYVWKLLRGDLLSFSYRGSSFPYFHAPRLLSVLFSSNHGLFSWHPIIALSLAGLCFSKNVQPALRWAILTCFLMELYLTASWWMWWMGYSFGNRSFLSLTPLFVLGMASVVSRLLAARKKRLMLACCSVLFLWNLLLMAQYLSESIPYQGEFSWVEFIKNIPRIPDRILQKANAL